MFHIKLYAVVHSLKKNNFGQLNGHYLLKNDAGEILDESNTPYPAGYGLVPDHGPINAIRKLYSGVLSAIAREKVESWNQDGKEGIAIEYKVLLFSPPALK
jgi:hypothetical protein